MVIFFLIVKNVFGPENALRLATVASFAGDLLSRDVYYDTYHNTNGALLYIVLYNSTMSKNIYWDF